MPKWVSATVGLSVVFIVIAIAYRIFIGDGGTAQLGSFEVSVLPAKTSTVEAGNTQPKKSEIKPDKKGVETSPVGAALVFDPPSNVRNFPNGKILCSITSPGTIPIHNRKKDWYYTDVCGEMGVIHKSQLSFKSNSLK